MAISHDTYADECKDDEPESLSPELIARADELLSQLKPGEVHTTSRLFPDIDGYDSDVLFSDSLFLLQDYLFENANSHGIEIHMAPWAVYRDLGRSFNLEWVVYKEVPDTYLLKDLGLLTSVCLTMWKTAWNIHEFFIDVRGCLSHYENSECVIDDDEVLETIGTPTDKQLDAMYKSIAASKLLEYEETNIPDLEFDKAMWEFELTFDGGFIKRIEGYGNVPPQFAEVESAIRACLGH